MHNIWFSSDFHAYHKNICKGSTNWSNSQRCRNFKNEEEMTERLISNINANVGPNDTLYFLGDWSFGGIDNIGKFWVRIHCKNIHFVLGNHDHHIKNNRTLPNIFRVSPELPLAFMANPDTKQAAAVRAQELFKSVSGYKEVTVDNQRIILCHYAMRVWNKSHHGSWMLYGHSHGTLPDYVQSNMVESENVGKGRSRGLKSTLTRSMDVGVDTHPQFRPYNFDEIKEIFKDRPPLGVDHHSKNTN